MLPSLQGLKIRACLVLHRKKNTEPNITFCLLNHLHWLKWVGSIVYLAIRTSDFGKIPTVESLRLYKGELSKGPATLSNVITRNTD